MAHAALTVFAFGLGSAEESGRLCTALNQVPGVTDCSPAAANPAELHLSWSGDAASFAKALDGAQDVGLRVEGVQGERVVTHTAPTRKARVPFRLQPFEDRSKPKALADVARLAQDATRILLQNAPFLVEAAQPDDALLVFTGRVSLDGPTHIYEVRILRAKSGEIAYGKGKGEDGFIETLQRMVKGLPQRLAELEGAHFQKDAGLMALPKLMERTGKALPLRLVKADVPPLLASRGAAPGQPLATLWVDDLAKEALSDVVARGAIEGLSSAASAGPPTRLAPGAGNKLPVGATVDTGALQKAIAPSVVRLNVELAYPQGDSTRTAAFAVPLWLEKGP